ncbi:MAG: hypothetical protein ACE5DI_00355 [Candidatus Micrarchaeia archaeon]
MAFLFEPVFLAFVLSLVHLFTHFLAERVEKWHVQIISFGAGVFIVFMFLDLFPEALKTEYSYSFFLLGFVVFHSVEKYVYQHTNPKLLKEQVGSLDVLGFIVADVFKGIALVFAYVVDPSLGFFIFIPLVLDKVSSATLFAHLLERFKHYKWLGFALSFSVLLGALFASFVSPSGVLFEAAFAMVVGTLLYIVVRDLIPHGRKGNLTYFLLGALFSYAILARVL